MPKPFKEPESKEKMNTMRVSLVLSLVVIVTAGLILIFGGCSNDLSLSPDDSSSAESMSSLSKGKDSGKGGGGKGDGQEEHKPGYSDYPQSGSVTLVYDKDYRAYTGGNIVMDNTSKLHIYDYSFTPPPHGPKNQPVNITMTADLVENGNNVDVIFTFSPSGSQFSPAAQIWLDWHDMGTGKVPGLYYIEEDGTWTELDPVAVDKQNKKIVAYVSHFSRYALSISR